MLGERERERERGRERERHPLWCGKIETGRRGGCDGGAGGDGGDGGDRSIPPLRTVTVT